MSSKKPETTTTETEDNTEQLAREEHVRLARQLRIMENDKRAYLEESNAAINQHRKTIRALEEENRKIQMELDAQDALSNEIFEAKNMEKILQLVDEYVKLEEEVKNEMTVVTEIENRVQISKTRLSKLRARVEIANLMPGGDQKDIDSKEIEAKEYSTKKKLQTVTSQYDAIVAENGELRKNIDHILKENVRILKRCKEAEQLSNKNKSEIDDLVDEATTAYDQREEAVAKANVLFERNEKEKKQYVLEISELNRLIRHEEKLLSFLSIKNQDRVFLETDEERISRLESAKEQTQDETLQSYRENLVKLLTGESPTLESLVDEYVKLWTENVNRFNYINELNNEIEVLQADTESLREEIKQCTTETVERNQKKNAEIALKRDELDAMKDEFGSVRKTVDSYKSTMEEIVKLIERLFYITDYEDAKPVLELMGTNKEVSSQNSILYLNILESRLNEILSVRRPSSGRTTPKSPRPQIKSVSDISMSANRPLIVISDQAGSLDERSEEDAVSSIVDEEPSPLEYLEMRGKILESYGSKNPSENESLNATYQEDEAEDEEG